MCLLESKCTSPIQSSAKQERNQARTNQTRTKRKQERFNQTRTKRNNETSGLGAGVLGGGGGASPDKPSSASKLFFPRETDYSQRQTSITRFLDLIRTLSAMNLYCHLKISKGIIQWHFLSVLCYFHKTFQFLTNVIKLPNADNWFLSNQAVGAVFALIDLK